MKKKIKIKEDVCETCGEEAFAKVCQGCQEMVTSCDCTRLSREEYQEWLKFNSQK